MIPTTPAPRFLLVRMAKLKPMTLKGGIQVDGKQPCGMGVVVNNNSKLHEHLKPGDVVFFPIDQINFVLIDPMCPHGAVFEEAVFLSAKAGEIEVEDNIPQPKADIVQATPAFGGLPPIGPRKQRLVN